MLNIFERCLKDGMQREATHWERQKCRVYGHFSRKIEANGGVLPAVCYQIKAYDSRGNPFRSTEAIDIDARYGAGWWERIRAGQVGHPATRWKEYGSKWILDDFGGDVVEMVV